jgi:hypothetical protein
LTGWEPREYQTHHYDDGGRLVQTITTRETEWSIDDVALLTAQMEYEADLGSHGQPMSEATDPLADPNLRGKGYQYEAFSIRDYAADELARASAALKKQYPDDPSVDSLVWSVRKVTKAPVPQEGG